jgi:hypothetical protein
MASTEVLENMKRTTHGVLDAFDKLDYEAFRALQADEFTYEFHPAALGLPTRDKVCLQ